MADRAAIAAACRRADCAATSLSRIFVQGMLTNVLNPKVALFFLAFLPQFVDPAGTHRLAAFLLLGTVFNTTGLVWNLFVAWSSAGIGRRMTGLPGRMHALHRIAGAVFVVLGVKLALTARHAAKPRSSRGRLAFDRRRCALCGCVSFRFLQLALALFFLLFLLLQFLLPFLVLIVGFCQG